jgi:hypothetical protein
MNLLSLVGPRLNNIYQIRRKLYYSSGSFFFPSKRGLNTAKAEANARAQRLPAAQAAGAEDPAAPPHVTATAGCSRDTDGRDRAEPEVTGPDPDVGSPPFPTLPLRRLGPRTRIQWQAAVVVREPRAASPSGGPSPSKQGRHVNQGGQHTRHVSDSEWHARRGEGRISVWAFCGPVYMPNFSSNSIRKKRFFITLKCRHMYGVLNIDEIKN